LDILVPEVKKGKRGNKEVVFTLKCPKSSPDPDKKEILPNISAFYVKLNKRHENSAA
jgi:hypothetical protein